MESTRVSLSVSFGADVANYRGFVWTVDVCTQPTHMHIDTVGLRTEFMVLYILDESCARQQLAAPLHHLLEQLEFARMQINRAGTTASQCGRLDRAPVIPRAAPLHALRPTAERKDQFPCYLDDRERLFREAADLPDTSRPH